MDNHTIMCQHRPIYERVIYSILMLDPKNFGFPGGTRPGYDVSTWQVLHRLQPYSGVHQARPGDLAQNQMDTLVKSIRPDPDPYRSTVHCITLPGRDVC